MKNQVGLLGVSGIGAFVYAIALGVFVAGLPVPWWSAIGGWIAGAMLILALVG